MVGWRAATRRVKTELVAVHAMAVLVYGSTVVGLVLGGPWMILWFLPAMLGSLVAIWYVRYGIREGAPVVTRTADREERRG
ncbi:hypothetical protein [Streptomyces prasinus]|uniref:hypothetical protein n=2 Tax=Streptomyces prasinus TaxID=67345 RepID=UPI0036D003DF